MGPRHARTLTSTLLSLAATGAACTDGGQHGTHTPTPSAAEVLCTDTGGTWASASETCACGTNETWNATQGCVAKVVTTTDPKQVLCTATQGTWSADTKACTCPAKSAWTDANGCTTCSIACAATCDNMDDGEVCGADRNWWCPCELACQGVAEAASRLDCCDPVPSNCVPTCSDNRAGNCTSGMDARGCPRLNWTWETCGDHDMCTADFGSHRAACVPICDPPAACDPGCAAGMATTCIEGTGDNGCGTVATVQIPCGGMSCVADEATKSAECTDPCAPEDATFGTEECDHGWGYRWDGSTCSYQGGWCPCTGKDCEKLHGTADSCMAAHAICGAGTSDKTRCEASHGLWSDASGCDCMEGGAWNPTYGCWPKQQLLCIATGGTFTPAFCGPFCGACACPEGTTWDAADGCKP